MDDIPFPNLEISDFSFLNEIRNRHNCPRCGKSRMYYCYSCFLPLEQLKGKIPKVELPIEVDIIKHPGEVCGKSTAVHAAILAPDHVTIHIYPNIPDFDPLKTVLLYPCKESQTLRDHLTNISNESVRLGNATIERVVFIDSTWLQAFKIFSDPRLKEIPRIEIDNHNTKFWRYQLDKPSTYLSTIEAIYYCVKEYNELTKYLTLQENAEPQEVSGPISKLCISKRTYCGKYDNLLFFFSFFYQKIRRTAAQQGRSLKSYTNQRRGKKKNSQ